jgi:hypothetical protein
MEPTTAIRSASKWPLDISGRMDRLQKEGVLALSLRGISDLPSADIKKDSSPLGVSPEKK